MGVGGPKGIAVHTRGGGVSRTGVMDLSEHRPRDGCAMYKMEWLS